MPFIFSAGDHVGRLLETTMSPTKVIAVQVVTTTDFIPSPTDGSDNSTLSGHHGKPVPIGAIVGGLIGGIAFALIVVIIWTCWGRIIKKSQMAFQKENEKRIATRRNTRHNSSGGSTPRRDPAFLPVYGRPEKDKAKIKFADEKRQREREEIENRARVAADAVMAQVATAEELNAAHERRQRELAQSKQRQYVARQTPVPSQPKPLRPKPSQSQEPVIPKKSHLRSAFVPLRRNNPRPVEENNPSPRTSIIAALGFLDSAGRRLSNLTRSSGRSTPHEPSRLSEASSAQELPPVDEKPGVPIGFAYGGDE